MISSFAFNKASAILDMLIIGAVCIYSFRLASSSALFCSSNLAALASLIATAISYIYLNFDDSSSFLFRSSSAAFAA